MEIYMEENLPKYFGCSLAEALFEKIKKNTDPNHLLYFGNTQTEIINMKIPRKINTNIESIDKILNEYEKYMEKSGMKNKNYNIFFSDYSTIRPLIYNQIVCNSGSDEDKFCDKIFYGYLMTCNLKTIIFSGFSNMIDVEEFGEYIRKFYLKNWNSYCNDVINQVFMIENEDITIEEILHECKKNEKITKSYKYLFLDSEQLEEKISHFIEKTLENVIIIDCTSLKDIIINLIKIPIIYMNSKCKLGLVVLDAVNFLHNFEISITDDKSIITENFYIHYKNDKSFKEKIKRKRKSLQEKTDDIIDDYALVFKMINMYKKKLDFNFYNFIYDYGRKGFYKNINFNIKRKSSDLNSLQNLNGNIYSIDETKKFIYRIFQVPIQGIQIIPAESSSISPGTDKYFGMMYMQGNSECEIQFFKMNKKLEVISLGTEMIVMKKNR